MHTLKTLKPGQKGTKYVRCRCDQDRRERVKAVELVVERRSREGEARWRALARERSVTVPRPNPG